MKKIVRILFYRIASLSGMQWLMFAVFISVLFLVQACETSRHRYYTAVPVNKSDTATAKSTKAKNKKLTPDVNDEPVFGDDDEYDWFEEMEDLDRDR